MSFVIGVTVINANSNRSCFYLINTNVPEKGMSLPLPASYIYA